MWELKDVKFMMAEPLDFSRTQQLPSFRHLIQRFFTLLKDKDSTVSQVCHTLAVEFQNNWIYMNLYSISVKAIKEKFLRFLEDIYKMKRCAVSKRGKTWNDKADDLISILDNGVDIKATDPDVIMTGEEDFGVLEGEEEDLLYQDNCKVQVESDSDPAKHNSKYKDWLLGEWGRCSRLRWVAGVDKEWLKDVMETSTALEKIEANKIRKQMKIQREKEKLKKLKEPVQIASEEVLSEYLGEPDALEAVGADDQEYSPTISYVSSKTDLVPGERSTRSGIVISDIEEDTSSMFPKVPVRTGPQTLNVNLMSVLVQGIAKFNFSP